jgi:TATA-box binding protein (TBP) (component of TFIID and TFIIIB)
MSTEEVIFTPYKISTITATGGIGSHVNLEAFYKYIRIIDAKDASCNDDGFLYIEHGKKKGETFCKGFHKKMTIMRRKKKEGKRFDNQVTVILRINTGTSIMASANMKIFRNGNVQMTGIKSPDQGVKALEYIIESIREMTHRSAEESIVDDFNAMRVCDYRIRLINSDFKSNIHIKRDKLCKLMQNTYNIMCSYEPCIYPGVKIQFCWNTMPGREQNGVCDCINMCNGKGSGCGDGQCKRITIAAFQSGCVIITGAQSIAQINHAYEFICTAIRENLSAVSNILLVPMANEKTIEENNNGIVKKDAKADKRKVYISRTRIRIPEGYVLENY